MGCSLEPTIQKAVKRKYPVWKFHQRSNNGDNDDPFKNTVFALGGVLTASVGGL